MFKEELKLVPHAPGSYQMVNSDGIIMRVLSYIPFSSLISMFVRVAMGSVETIEVIISAVILIISTGVVGVLASKIYRRATLMYGNQIKLTKALKWLKR